MKIFFQPSEAIKDIKKEKSLGKSISILAIAAVIFAIIAAVGVSRITAVLPAGITMPQFAQYGIGIAAVATFLCVFIGGLFIGWILQIAMTTLGAKGDFFAGVTSIAYPLLIISVSTLIATFVAFIPLIGPVIAFIISLILVTIAFAFTYRAIKELFATDMITAFIGVLIVWSAAIAAGLYSSALGLLPTIGKIPTIPSIPGLG